MADNAARRGEEQAPADAERHVPGEVTFLVCVDESTECRVAMRFAGLRAKYSSGHVALLYVIEPGEFEHWMAVADLMREEQRQAAEELLQSLAAEVYDISGKMPVLHVREGRKGEQVLKLIAEDPSISIMVLGAAPDGEGSNELVRQLTAELTKRLRIPLAIVPGNLTDEQLRLLT